MRSRPPGRSRGPVQQVVPVHTRFCRGYAIGIPFLGGLLSRERFKELFVARTGVHDQASVLQFMADALPKLDNAPTPWGACVHLLTDHRGAWIVCPTTGFGFVYSTLREAMCRWNVEIYDFERERWLARPTRSSQGVSVPSRD